MSGLYTDGLTGATRGFIATPVSMPTGTTSGGAYVFCGGRGFPTCRSSSTRGGRRLRLPHRQGEPAHRHTCGLPSASRQPVSLKVEGRRFTLAGGELFDFRANGFRRGVEKFRVDCIEVDALLDPANRSLFHGITFMEAGMFTGTQKPSCAIRARRQAPVHGPRRRRWERRRGQGHGHERARGEPPFQRESKSRMTGGGRSTACRGRPGSRARAGQVLAHEDESQQ